jgi:ParB/RepB/Spo0J family partition protein
MTTPQTATPDRFERIPLDQLFASKTQPRENFDETALAELAASIKQKGVVQPILVRQVRGKSGYEIVAGERRVRASKLAANGVTDIPAIIRALDDEAVLEIQLIENIQRRDLTPLEQAKGYRALIDSNPTKHSAESIAARLGMSPQWVWDRMKLNDLIPPAKKFLAADRISVGHAILIARLKAEDQIRVIHVGTGEYGDKRGGLWTREEGLPYDEAARKKDPSYGLKAVTVRELQHWIDDHVRFDVEHAAHAAPLVFGDVAERVAAVEQQARATASSTAMAERNLRRALIAITHEHYTQPEARDEDERTYGPKSWKRADGTRGNPKCEHATLGVVAAGADRGQAFDVCIARDKCVVHWKREVNEKKKREKAQAAGKTTAAGNRKRQEAALAARDARDKAEREARELRWKTFKPALEKATRAAVAKLNGTLPKPVFAKLLAAYGLPGSTKPAGLSRALLDRAIGETFRYDWSGNEAKMVSWAKALKVDVKSCEPVQTSGVTAKPQAKAGGR